MVRAAILAIVLAATMNPFVDAQVSLETVPPIAQDTDSDLKAIPASSDFHFGRITADGKGVLELVQVPYSEEVQEDYIVQVPYTEEVVVDGKIGFRQKFRDEIRTRNRTVERIANENRVISASRCRFLTIEGHEVNGDDLIEFANRPLVMFNPGEPVLKFHRQLFAPGTLMCYPVEQAAVALPPQENARRN